MKKIISVLFAVMSAAMLMACGSSAKGSSLTVEDGVLTMATNAYFPPYEYYEGDTITGIDSIITAVSTGKADMGLAGMTVTEERKKNVNFSDTYATGVQVVIVKEDSDIASIDDLQGKKIGVQLSTTGDIYCTDDFGSENVEEYNKGNDAVMALVSGKVDAVVIDNEPAKSYVAANEGLKILETEYVTEDYAAALNKDNTELLEQINGALKELKDEGKLDEIISKYIKSE